MTKATVDLDRTRDLLEKLGLQHASAELANILTAAV
jgi:hypothetical protein